MKTVEIDIDATSSANDLIKELKQRKLQKGDALYLFSSVKEDNYLLLQALYVLAAMAIIIFLNKQKNLQIEALLQNVFKDSVKEIQEGIKKEYDIEITLHTKDEEHLSWQKFSKEQLSKAYGTDEPEYDLNMIKEPNPRYKNERR